MESTGLVRSEIPFRSTALPKPPDRTSATPLHPVRPPDPPDTSSLKLCLSSPVGSVSGSRRLRRELVSGFPLSPSFESLDVVVLLRYEFPIRRFNPPPDRAGRSLDLHRLILRPVQPSISPPSEPPEPPDPPDPPDLRVLVLKFSVSPPLLYLQMLIAPLTPSSAMVASIIGLPFLVSLCPIYVTASLAGIIFCYSSHGSCSYNPAALYIVIYIVAAWSGLVLLQSSEAQSLCYVLSLRVVFGLVGERCSSDKLSFTSRLIQIICLSTILLSLANQSFYVLLLAGEGTSGSWIPGFVNLHILVRRCKSLGSESSLIHLEAPSDNCVLLPCDLFQGPNAEMFSSPSVWELFNFSPSSVGTERTLPSSSLFRERIFPPGSLPMKEYLPDSLPVNSVNLVTVLFSCVAVRTGPEETTELTLVILGGEDWLSKSSGQVTTSRSLGFAVMISLSQASFVSILLSINLSALSLFASLICCIFSRGWLIPSIWCKVTV